MKNDVTKRIEEPVIERETNRRIKSVTVTFGPHHFVNVSLKDGKVVCAMGATHHGVLFEASEVMGPFEEAVNLLMKSYPHRAF